VNQNAIRTACRALIVTGLSALAPAMLAQQAQSHNTAPAPASAAATTEPFPPAASQLWNQGLPRWMQVTGEYRVRMESLNSLRFSRGVNDAYLLHRIRVNLQVRPASWLRFYFQGQDSRVFGNQVVPDAPPYADAFDLRLGFVELGDAEKSAVSLRAGRQELSFGEERLLGPANWGNTSRSFDAVVLNLRHASSGYEMKVFASSVVRPYPNRFNNHLDGDALHGITGKITSWIPQTTLQPFVFWRVAPQVTGEAGPGRLDFKTIGIRGDGRWSKTTDYAFKLAGQTGHFGPDVMRTAAVHFRLGYDAPTARTRLAPRLVWEYNFATGDRNPNDGRHQTFDLIYPTPHDKYGLDDQVGWRNIHHLGHVVEVKPARNLRAQLKYHNWWLASTRDGLYAASGALIVRPLFPSAGRYVGQELDLQAVYPFSSTLQLGIGYGHIFPGTFLKRAAPGSSFDFFYSMATYRF
jgi:hypothetical protein